MALPNRAEPQPQPSAPRLGHRRGHDGHPLLRPRREHGGQGPRARGIPPPRRRHPRAARDAEDRPGPARDGRPVLRADRRGHGDHGLERQVPARARAGVAGRGGRGAPALLRRGPDRARRGRRGPEAASGPPRAPPPASVQALLGLPLPVAPDQQGAGGPDADRAVRRPQEAGHLPPRPLGGQRLGCGDGRGRGCRSGCGRRGWRRGSWRRRGRRRCWRGRRRRSRYGRGGHRRCAGRLGRLHLRRPDRDRHQGCGRTGRRGAGDRRRG